MALFICTLWFIHHGCSQRAVADRYGVEEHTVSRWKRRYYRMIDWSQYPSAVDILDAVDKARTEARGAE